MAFGSVYDTAFYGKCTFWNDRQWCGRVFESVWNDGEWKPSDALACPAVLCNFIQLLRARVSGAYKGNALDGSRRCRTAYVPHSGVCHTDSGMDSYLVGCGV